MTDYDPFTAHVRGTLHDAADRAVATPFLAERIINAALPGTERANPRWSWTRLWLIVGSAAAVGVVVAAVLITNANYGGHTPPAASAPTASVVPTPSPSPTVSPSSAAPSTPVPAGFHSVSGYFLDQNAGWVLGDGKCATSNAINCAALIATINGGSSWHALTVPTGLVSTQDDYGSCGDNGYVNGPCVSRVLFATAQVGYLWSFHSFYLTTNGGQTWQAEAGGRALDVVSNGRRVLRLAPVRDCSSGCAGKLQVADVGSMDWTTVTPGGATPALFSTTITAGPTGFYTIGASIADVSNNPTIVPIYLYRSTDDGRTWTTAHKFTDGIAPSALGNPADGSVVWIGGGVAIGGPRSSTSTDGGKTFGPIRKSIPGASTSDGTALAAASGSSLLEYVTSTTDTKLYLTQDQGSTWNLVATVQKFAADSITFSSARSGYVTGRGATAMLTSVDGGQTWVSHSF
jgi:hypothetical protein